MDPEIFLRGVQIPKRGLTENFNIAIRNLNLNSLLVTRQMRSEIAEWLAHWLLVLEVPGSILAGGEENLLVRTCFPSCHLQE